MSKDLERLRQLADLVKAEEMARLGTLKSQVAEVQDQIAALRLSVGQAGQDPAYCQTGGDARWARWCQQEIGRLNMALARLRAAEPEQARKTRLAVARTQVLGRLHAQAAAARKPRGG